MSVLQYNYFNFCKSSDWTPCSHFWYVKFILIFAVFPVLILCTLTMFFMNNNFWNSRQFFEFYVHILGNLPSMTYNFCHKNDHEEWRFFSRSDIFLPSIYIGASGTNGIFQQEMIGCNFTIRLFVNFRAKVMAFEN